MTRGAELGTVDAVAILQDTLGIDEAAAMDLASIKLRCPAPGQEEESSFGDFITSKHGAEQGAKDLMEDIADEAQVERISHEEAIVRTLGKRAVIRDEHTGAIARIAQSESKKK